MEKWRDNSPKALISGIVTKVDQLTNHWSHNGYKLVTVSTYIGDFDVVVAEEKAEGLAEGVQVEMLCWMFACAIFNE
jgi:hypothetical protein